MACADVAAVADALCGRRHEFFFEHGLLRQKHSTVGFIFHGTALIAAETEADSDCRLLSQQDALRLSAAFEEWHRDYWIAARVNSIFARQLRRAGIWRRLWYHIERHLPERQRESALALYARAFAGDDFAGEGSNGEPRSGHRPPSSRPKPCGCAFELHCAPQLLE